MAGFLAELGKLSKHCQFNVYCDVMSCTLNEIYVIDLCVESEMGGFRGIC